MNYFSTEQLAEELWLMINNMQLVNLDELINQVVDVDENTRKFKTVLPKELLMLNPQSKYGECEGDNRIEKELMVAMIYKNIFANNINVLLENINITDDTFNYSEMLSKITEFAEYKTLKLQVNILGIEVVMNIPNDPSLSFNDMRKRVDWYYQNIASNIMLMIPDLIADLCMEQPKTEN